MADEAKQETHVHTDGGEAEVHVGEGTTPSDQLPHEQAENQAAEVAQRVGGSGERAHRGMDQRVEGK